MPKLSPTMETGVIAQWLVKVGDTVKEGDVLADIETDKATMPMKSYDDGTIVHIDHAAGDEVALGQRVLVLAKKGEDPKRSPRSWASGGAQARLTGASKPKTAAEPPPVDGRVRGREPLRRQRSADRGCGTTACRRRPRQGQPARPQGGRRGERRHPPGERHRAGRPDHPPRRRAVPPEEAAAGEATAAAPPASRPRSSLRAPRSSPPPLAAQRIPHSRMRKTIAQRMSQAKQTAPEIHLTVDIRVDRIVAARAEINKHLAAEGIKVSIGDFVTKAVALALCDFIRA